jgi:hypothetical protein
VALYKILHRALPVPNLVGPKMVVSPFPFLKGSIEMDYLHISIIDLVELLSVGPLGSLHMAVKFGGAGWQDEKSYPSLLAGLLEDGLNSEPPSTCKAFMGKGIRLARVSKKPTAVAEVALVCVPAWSGSRSWPTYMPWPRASGGLRMTARHKLTPAEERATK